MLQGDNDQLILVDEHDREIGFLDPQSCHDGLGVRHRAFSIWLTNPHGELLVHQRAAGKRLWANFWSNSCCSHPRRGESVIAAARRRMRQELGLEVDNFEWRFSFNYQASFGAAGSENEHCHVLLAKSEARPAPNPEEVAAVQWLSPATLDMQIMSEPERWTPWMKQQWQRLRSHFL